MKEESVKAMVSGQELILSVDVSLIKYTTTTTECNGPHFRTVIDCGSLTSPANGAVDFVRTTYRAMAFYSCDPGFFLQGVSKRTCQGNGQWSSEEPTCQRKYGSSLAAKYWVIVTAQLSGSMP